MHSNWCVPCLSAWRGLGSGWAGLACWPRLEYCKWWSTCFLRLCPSGVHGAVWVPSPLAGQLVDGHGATEAEQRPQSGRGGRQGSWCTRTLSPSDKLVRFLPPNLIFVRAVMVWGWVGLAVRSYVLFCPLLLNQINVVKRFKYFVSSKNQQILLKKFFQLRKVKV